MNLYEFEGKKLFEKYKITTPKGVVIYRGDNAARAYADLGMEKVVVKAQVLSGKRGKNNAIRFCNTAQEVVEACAELTTLSVFTLNTQCCAQYVAAVRIEEKLDIAEEHYLSITYDTSIKQPVLIYSEYGGVDIEDVPNNRIKNYELRIMNNRIDIDVPYAQELWDCFLNEDARMVEINPLVKTTTGQWIAADAKVALDDGAEFRHNEWKDYASRTMLGRLPTALELEARKIDEGQDWYRGTAGKYIELDGDIAVLFSGGGASIANMDGLIRVGLRPANYTEYSGNPPREKVKALAKIVLAKPGLKGLWIAGGVANFTNVQETFQGIADALDEIKPTYPIVVRRAGPYEKEGMRLMAECAERNKLNIKLFGKETSMSQSVKVLAEMIKKD